MSAKDSDGKPRFLGKQEPIFVTIEEAEGLKSEIPREQKVPAQALLEIGRGSYGESRVA